ncbi:hypothetical protein BJ878DRAFT_20440, partial [Calycina marina]
MPHEVLKTMVNSGWIRMEKYYSKTDESPACAASIILNHVRKEKRIETFWRPSRQELTKEAVRKLREEEHRTNTTMDSAASIPTYTTNEFELLMDAIDVPV